MDSQPDPIDAQRRVWVNDEVIITAPGEPLPPADEPEDEALDE